MKKIQSIHFVGIKGVGMAPLALIAKEAGVAVTGSDTQDIFITDESLQKAGIALLVGFASDHVGAVDLVITTGAHGGFDNVEVRTAKEKNIPVVSQGEAVGMFMQGDIFGKKQTGISIFGSHGKTTTTAMIATIFKAYGMDPSYLIGTSTIPSLGASGHYGKGNYFVAEADEYATEPVYDKTPKLLWQHPHVAVCTNIELDHTDIYPSVDALVEVFTTFINGLGKEGMLICCGDDPNVLKMIEKYNGKKKTYGIGKENDYQLTDITISAHTTSFSMLFQGENIGIFTIAVPGEHNALNAAAAIITAIVLGLDKEKVKGCIAGYKGSKRRLEYIGTLPSGALLYDDYAHHPTEITASLTALKKSLPGKKLVCIFQPHTYTRTKALFTEFSKAFSSADEVILTAIYASMREKADLSVSMEDLARQIKLNGKNCRYLPKPIDVVKYVQEKAFGADTLIVTMGAGDVYKIAQELEIHYG